MFRAFLMADQSVTCCDNRAFADVQPKQLSRFCSNEQKYDKRMVCVNLPDTQKPPASSSFHHQMPSHSVCSGTGRNTTNDKTTSSQCASSTQDTSNGLDDDGGTELDASSQKSVSLLQPRSSWLSWSPGSNIQEASAPSCHGDTLPSETSMEEPASGARLHALPDSGLEAAFSSAQPGEPCTEKKADRVLTRFSPAAGCANIIVTGPLTTGLQRTLYKSLITDLQSVSHLSDLQQHSTSQPMSPWRITHTSGNASHITCPQNISSVTSALHMARSAVSPKTCPVSGLQETESVSASQKTSGGTPLCASSLQDLSTTTTESCRQDKQATYTSFCEKPDTVPQILGSGRQDKQACEDQGWGGEILSDCRQRKPCAQSDSSPGLTVLSSGGPTQSWKASARCVRQPAGEDGKAVGPGSAGYRWRGKAKENALKCPRSQSRFAAASVRAVFPVSPRENTRRRPRASQNDSLCNAPQPRQQSEVKALEKTPQLLGGGRGSTCRGTSQRQSSLPAALGLARSATRLLAPGGHETASGTASDSGMCALAGGAMLSQPLVAVNSRCPAVNANASVTSAQAETSACTGRPCDPDPGTNGAPSWAGHAPGDVTAAQADDVIPGVRMVLLVADDEMAAHSDHSEWRHFWNADFSSITMSAATWSSVDTWE